MNEEFDFCVEWIMLRLFEGFSDRRDKRKVIWIRVLAYSLIWVGEKLQ